MNTQAQTSHQNGVQEKVIELLYWMRDAGMTPVSPHQNHRHLNPLTRKIHRYSRLSENQKRYALWLPTADGLKHVMPDLTIDIIGTMHIAQSDTYVGAGIGESEAILSLVHDMRRRKFDA